jgi:anti-sigma-K factor RskA
MPPTPVDEHTAEFEQLAGLSALEVLEGDELALFEQHAAVCERCRLMVRLDKAALASLALSAPEMDPSPDFKARLLQRAAEELQASEEPIQLRPRADPDERPDERPRAVPGNVVPLWRRSPWMSALAAVFVVGIVSAGAFSYENQPVATYQLNGNAPGSAEVVIRRSGAAELVMHGVPDPDPGFVYEAWIIPPGSQPVAAGITARGDASLPLPANVRGSTVAITKEHGKVDAPTSTPLMAAVVQS